MPSFFGNKHQRIIDKRTSKGIHRPHLEFIDHFMEPSNQQDPWSVHNFHHPKPWRVSNPPSCLKACQPWTYAPGQPQICVFGWVFFTQQKKDPRHPNTWEGVSGICFEGLQSYLLMEVFVWMFRARGALFAKRDPAEGMGLPETNSFHLPGCASGLAPFKEAKGRSSEPTESIFSCFCWLLVSGRVINRIFRGISLKFGQLGDLRRVNCHHHSSTERWMKQFIFRKISCKYITHRIRLWYTLPTFGWFVW